MGLYVALFCCLFSFYLCMHAMKKKNRSSHGSGQGQGAACVNLLYLPLWCFPDAKGYQEITELQSKQQKNRTTNKEATKMANAKDL